MFYLYATKRNQPHFLIRNENITKMLNSYFTQNLEEFAKSENYFLGSDCIFIWEHRDQNSRKFQENLLDISRVISKTAIIICTLFYFFLTEFCFFLTHRCQIWFSNTVYCRKQCLNQSNKNIFYPSICSPGDFHNVSSFVLFKRVLLLYLSFKTFDCAIFLDMPRHVKFPRKLLARKVRINHIEMGFYKIFLCDFYLPHISYLIQLKWRDMTPSFNLLLLLWRKFSTITKPRGEINQSAIVSRSWTRFYRFNPAISLFIDPFSLFALNKGLLTNNVTFIISKSSFLT